MKNILLGSAAAIAALAFAANGFSATAETTKLEVANESNSFLTLESAELLDEMNCKPLIGGKLLLADDHIVGFDLRNARKDAFNARKRDAGSKPTKFDDTTIYCEIKAKIRASQNLELRFSDVQVLGKAIIAQEHVLFLNSTVSHDNGKVESASFRTYPTAEKRLKIDMQPLVSSYSIVNGKSSCAQEFTVNMQVRVGIAEESDNEKGSKVRLQSPKKMENKFPVEFWLDPRKC